MGKPRSQHQRSVESLESIFWVQRDVGDMGVVKEKGQRKRWIPLLHDTEPRLLYKTYAKALKQPAALQCTRQPGIWREGEAGPLPVANPERAFGRTGTGHFGPDGQEAQAPVTAGAYLPAVPMDILPFP